MARLPEITRRNPLSQVAAQPAPQAGQGWMALANMASMGANFVKPAALKQSADEGLKSIYRDDSGTLKVTERSALGGEMAAAHNSAAFAKYLAQSRIDQSQTFTELAQKHQFDPAGFKDASDAYIKLLQADATVPASLKEDLILSAQQESNNRFNGLYQAQTTRNYQDANVATKTQRGMLADDYVNLMLGGDTEGAAKKYAELESLSKFRESAPYIGDTPVETQAYLRGVRGAAKVAQITKQLGDLGSATSITPEMRKHIDDVLKDPDIDPDSRRKLYAATGGFLKGIDANAMLDGMSGSDYVSKVIRVESGGNPTAANPNSSALGLGQFTSGTWLSVVKGMQAQGGAKWADGLSKDEILAMRTNPGASQEGLKYLSAQTEVTLSKNGLPVNDATKYMGHFFGDGGAVALLTGDPSAMVRDILPDAVKSNPFLTNMTAQDAYNWAARKMTVKASDLSLQRANLQLINDTEVRGMVAQGLNERIRDLSLKEDAAAAPYLERIGQKDPSLTSQEVLNDNSLADDVQQKLVAELQKQRAAQVAIGETIGRLNDPGANWTVADPTERKSINDAYDNLLGDQSPMSPGGMSLALGVADKTGYLPQKSIYAIQSAMAGKDPAMLAGSMEFLNQVLERQPGALKFTPNGSDLEKSLADYRYQSGLTDGVSAAQAMIDANTPEAKARRTNLTDQAKKAAKDLSVNDVTSFFADRGAPITVKDQGFDGAVMSDYEKLFTQAYMDTGDTALAKNRALTQIANTYGPETVTGSNRAMKFPPNKFYPQSPLAPNWMRDQLVNEVSTYAYGDAAKIPGKPEFRLGQPELLSGKKMDVSRITLNSDEQTRSEVSAGQRPSYVVTYMDDEGNLQRINQRYRFDPTVVQNAISDAGSTGWSEQQKADRIKGQMQDMYGTGQDFTMRGNN